MSGACNCLKRRQFYHLCSVSVAVPCTIMCYVVSLLCRGCWNCTHRDRLLQRKLWDQMTRRHSDISATCRHVCLCRVHFVAQFLFMHLTWSLWCIFIQPAQLVPLFFTRVELVCYSMMLETFVINASLRYGLCFILLRGILHQANTVFAALSPAVIIYLLFTCVMFLF